ncbi:MAG: hypothetical protein Q8P13_01405 [bacterium]|nr:hypothetical protein [bacterium]
MEQLNRLSNFKSKKYLGSLFATLFILVAIPATVFLSLNARQTQVPASSFVCPNPSSEKVGEKPDKAKAEIYLKALQTETSNIRAESRKIGLLRSEEKIKQDLSLRKKDLVKAMQTCPDKAIQALFSSAEVKKYKNLAAGSLEELREFEGSLEVRHVDFAGKSGSSYEYILHTKEKKKVTIHFANGIHDFVESRTVIKVKGAFLENNLLLDGSKKFKHANDITGGFEVVKQPGNPPVLGVQRTLLVKGHFASDFGVVDSSLTMDRVGVIFSRLGNFIYNTSFGQAAVSGGVLDGGYMGPPSCPNPWDQSFLRTYLDPKIDFRNYDRVILLLPMSDSCGVGYVYGGKMDTPTDEGTFPISFAYISSFLDFSSQQTFGTIAIQHEYGHGLGLGHAGFFGCALARPPSPECILPYEASDPVDTMGNISSMRYNSLHREMLGWMGEGRMKEITSSGTYTLLSLDDLSFTGTPRALKIPRGNGQYLYVEYRPDTRLGRGNLSDGILFHEKSSLGPTSLLLDANDRMGKGVYGEPFGSALTGSEPFIDKYTGSTVRLLSVSSTAVTVSVVLAETQPEGVDILTNTQADWNKPTGYLHAAGQKKDVDYADIYYQFDLKCTYGSFCANSYNQWNDCGSWPRASFDISSGACPRFTTAGNSVNVPTVAGFRYKYRVYIVTTGGSKEWIGESDVPSCSSGTCTTNISWPRVTYRVHLQKTSNSNPACGGGDYNTVSGCTDLITTDAIGSDSKVTFRGLPISTDFKAVVKVGDFNGGVHTVQNIASLGSSQTYSKTCTSSGNSCTIGVLNFNGNEPLVWAVRANSTSGPVLKDALIGRAGADGSFSGSWTWDYTAVAYPSSFSSCSAAGSECVSTTLSNNNSSNQALLTGVKAGVSYKRVVCIPTCSSSSNTYQNNTVTSSPTVAPLGAVTSVCLSENTLTKPTFAWGRPSGAVFENQNLEVRLGTSSPISNGVSLTQTSFTNPTTFLPNTRIFWRVNTKIVGGSWISSAFQEVTMNSCGQPAGIDTPGIGIVGDYYKSVLPLSTQYAFSRKEDKIDFNWQTGSPDPSLDPDNFSARYIWTAKFEAEIYRFTLKAAGITRVYLDWSNEPLMVIVGPMGDPHNVNAIAQTALKMSEGIHTIRIDYSELKDRAILRFNFFKAKECLDLDGSKKIDSADQLLLSKHIGEKGISAYDLTLDGVVNSADQLKLAQNYGQTCS